MCTLPTAGRGAAQVVELDLESFEAERPEWDALALRAGNPFLTVGWLAAAWRAFAGQRGVALALRDDDGLRAGACFVRQDDGTLAALADAHTNDWDAVAVDEDARCALWETVAARGWSRMWLSPVIGGRGAEAARAALAQEGYRLAVTREPPSPWLELPSSYEDLLAGCSRNLRSQVRRRTKALRQEGVLELTVSTAGEELERDLDALLEIEASGWKGTEGTAIASSPALARRYREFARSAAAAGWMRLYLLRLDGCPIAGDYGCAFAGCGYLVKTGFDERYERLAPGLVLRSEVLRASIEEGLRRYDFLGGPDPYKLRWTGNLRGRSTLQAFRGPRQLPAYAWWSTLRPALKRGRHVLRRARHRD